LGGLGGLLTDQAMPVQDAGDGALSWQALVSQILQSPVQLARAPSWICCRNATISSSNAGRVRPGERCGCRDRSVKEAGAYG